jgi:D-arabinose 1-dehydrogenase-like Zn-dependent alcohol dehydrogenase/uncharacterized protein (DUF1330 family)
MEIAVTVLCPPAPRTAKGVIIMPAEPENALTSPAYFVAEVEIHDPAGFKSYADQFASTLAPFGGRLVSFGAPIIPLEGIETTKARAAIVVFPASRRVATGSPRPRIGRLRPSGKSRPTRALFRLPAFRFPRARTTQCLTTHLSSKQDGENMSDKVRAYAAVNQGDQLKPFEYDPGALGPDQVEIAVEYCGLCHSDLSMYDNEWGMTDYPFVPGHEVIGKISATGEQVEARRVGQRVGLGWFSGSCMSCHHCLSGDHNLCSDPVRNESTIVHRHGGFADRVRAHWIWTQPIPDVLDFKKAGPLFCGGITVFNPIIQNNVKPTDRVLSTVNATLDWQSYIESLGPKGRFVTVGIVTDPVQLGAFPLIAGQKSFGGSPLGSPSTVEKMTDFCARHSISPVTENFKLSEVNDAFDHLRAGKARYRIVLTNDIE